MSTPSPRAESILDESSTDPLGSSDSDEELLNESPEINEEKILSLVDLTSQSDGAVVTGPDCGKDITPSGSTISGKDHEKEISQSGGTVKSGPDCGEEMISQAKCIEPDQGCGKETTQVKNIILDLQKRNILKCNISSKVYYLTLLIFSSV